MLLLQPSHIEILLSVNLMFFVVVTYVTMVTNLCIMSSIPQLKYIMARNLGHSAEGVAGSEIIASLKIQLKNS